MCQGRSTWEVVKRSADFQKAQTAYAGSYPPNVPSFEIIQSIKIVNVIVLDVSGSMTWKKTGKDDPDYIYTYIDKMIDHTTFLIEQEISEEIYLGVVSFR